MAGSDGISDGGVAVVRHSPHEWTREWRFLIWTWTLTSWSDDCFVETVQRRFLGEEVVRRYSRTLWKVMAWASVLASAAGVVSTLVLVSLLAEGMDRMEFVLMALVCALLVLGSSAVTYFTFVPPKEYRVARRV